MSGSAKLRTSSKIPIVGAVDVSSSLRNIFQGLHLPNVAIGGSSRTLSSSRYILKKKDFSRQSINEIGESLHQMRDSVMHLSMYLEHEGCNIMFSNNTISIKSTRAM
jgi:hypothetical protein